MAHPPLLNDPVTPRAPLDRRHRRSRQSPRNETVIHGDAPLRDLKVKERKVTELKPHPKNARTHSNKQLHQLAKSIETFGFTVPILIDDKDVILAGHGRVEAAKSMGIQRVPTILIGDLTEDQNAPTSLQTIAWLSSLVGMRTY